MPEYSYECDSCGSKFSLISSISSYKAHPKCECGQKANRSYREDCLTINGSVKKGDGELKTLGDLAMRNTERMSEDQKAELHAKHNAYKETPSNKPLPKGMKRLKKTKGIKWT